MDLSTFFLVMLIFMVLLVVLVCFARQDDKDATMQYLRQWEEEQNQLERGEKRHEDDRIE